MKYLNWLHGGQLILAGVALLSAIAAPMVDGWLIGFAAVMFGVACLVLLSHYSPPVKKAVGLLVNGRLRLQLFVGLLLGAFITAFMLAMLTPLSRLPSLWLYLPFLLIAPWLIVVALAVEFEQQPALKVIAFYFKITLAVFIFAASLELLLQIAFNRLPVSLRTRMPQVALRSGITDRTPGGWREFPAGESLSYSVDGRVGDLYELSCLARPKEPLFPAYTVSFTRDDHGFRNAVWPAQVEMVVAGDSFTAGESVQAPFWQQITPTALGLGLPDSGSGEQFELLKAYGLPRKPRLVVMAYFVGNDLFDTWTFAQVKQSGLSYYEWSMRGRSPAEFLVTFRLPFWLMTRPQTAGCPYPIKDARGQAVAFYDPFFSTASFSASQLRGSTFYTPTREAIVGAAQQAKESGAAFVLLLLPTKAQAHWNLLSADQIAAIAQHAPLLDVSAYGLPSDSTSAVQRLRSNLFAQRDVLTELARDQGFLVLDLTPTFQTATEAGSSLYFYGDTHWNQAGHDLARQTLKAFLAQHGLLK